MPNTFFQLDYFQLALQEVAIMVRAVLLLDHYALFAIVYYCAGGLDLVTSAEH
jgi:hypothetical protein